MHLMSKDWIIYIYILNLLILKYMEEFLSDKDIDDKVQEQDTQMVSDKTKEYRTLLKQFQNTKAQFVMNTKLIQNFVYKMHFYKINKSEFEKMYKEIMDEEIKINDQTKLKFILSKPKQYALFLNVHDLILPRINSITICSLAPLNLA